MFTASPRTVEALEEEVAEFADPPEELDDDDMARLVDALVALADGYGRRGDFAAERRVLERLDRLHEAYPTTDVDIHLAVARANAAAVDDRATVRGFEVDPSRIDDHREAIERLYDERPEPTIAVPLARATAETIHACGRAELPDRIEPLVDRLETLYDSHEEADVAAGVARGYAHAERYRAGSAARDGDETHEARGGDETHEEAGYLGRAEELHRAHPDRDVAVGLAGVLAGRTNADAAAGDLEALEGRIARIDAIADRHPAAEREVLRWLPIATANATRASFDRADEERIERWVVRTRTLHDRLDTPTSATWAAVATFFSARASFFAADMETGMEELEELRTLETAHDAPVFEHWLGLSLFDAARAAVETRHDERARELADELAAYAVGHRDQERIEAGLDALRSHAPAVFPTDASDTDSVEVPIAGAETATDSVADGARTGSAVDEPETKSDDSGGSCGSGGCGGCTPEAAEPASLPALAAGAALLAIVVASVAYAGYRLLRLAGSSFRSADRR